MNDSVVARGWGWSQQKRAGPTCPIFHILHLHNFSVDSTPEDVEGAIDGFGPFGRLLAPSDPERQLEVSVLHQRQHYGGERRDREEYWAGVRSVGGWLGGSRCYLSKSFLSQTQFSHLENRLTPLPPPPSHFSANWRHGRSPESNRNYS